MSVNAGPKPGRARRFVQSRALRSTVHTINGATLRVLRARRASREPVWTWGVSLLCLLAAVIIVAVHPFDAAAIRFVEASDAPALDWLRAVTDAGKFHWYMLPALAVLLAAAAADWPARAPRGRAALALFYAQAAFALNALLNVFLAGNALKVVIGRARPKLLDEFGATHFQPFTPGYDFASFPSGHASACGTVAACLILWWPRSAWAVLPVMGGLAATRIAASAHYPSDVVGGFAFGFLATLLMARWLGSRRLAFRLLPGRLMPGLRHARSGRSLLSR